MTVNKNAIIISAVLVLLGAINTSLAESLSDEQLTELSNGFEQRFNTMLEAERGKPFRPRAIEYNWRGEGNHFARVYGQSVTRFAMISFLLDDQVEEANAALREMCEFYLREPKSMYNPDSFYWSHELYVRIYEFFNTRAPRMTTRLEPATEEILLRTLWEWSKKASKIADVQLKLDRKTWYFHSSENHVAMEYAAAWEFAQIFQRLPEYAQRTYEDGHTAAEHCEVLGEYHKEFCRERARRGMFFEVASSGYNVRTLMGLYNMVDLAEDEELAELAGKLLDLWWACWAQDQIDGVRGGGKARIRKWKALNGKATARGFTWFYFGQGMPMDSTIASLAVGTSKYRLPLVVMDLAMDVEGRGVYEVNQRRMGLAKGEHNAPPDSWFRINYGGLQRYLYCTPEFILGTNMREARPREEWHLGCSQSIWHGVIFNGHVDARIVPKCNHTTGDTFNEQWSVQRGGTLIAQKLKTAERALEMQVWFSSVGLSEPLEENGWAFAEADGAYAAVRPVEGGYHWGDPPAAAYLGKFLVLEDEWSPVILEVARKADHADYAAFRQAVASCPIEFDQQVLRYRGLGGDEFTFHADQTQIPSINGQAVNFTPEMVLDSPFVQSKWLSGQVTIRKGDRRLELDFNE